MKVILASGSPRRQQLMLDLIDNFEIIVSNVEEDIEADSAQQLVSQLSYVKAKDVFDRYSDCLVIGCDTVVEYNGVVFGKPRDYSDAYQMLHTLSDNTHNVHTGVTIMTPQRTLTFVESSKVTFNSLTEQFIVDYIGSSSPFDKAGGYGIQDGNIVKCIVGSYNNIVGLPTERLAIELHNMGIQLKHQGEK